MNIFVLDNNYMFRPLLPPEEAQPALHGQYLLTSRTNTSELNSFRCLSIAVHVLIIAQNKSFIEVFPLASLVIVIRNRLIGTGSMHYFTNFFFGRV